MAQYGEFDYTTCPRNFVTPDVLEIVQLAREGYLASIGVRETKKLPAKLVEAIRFVLHTLPPPQPVSMVPSGN